MTMKDFKTLTGLFAVMLSFGLLYTFNMVEPDYTGNVYSYEDTAYSEKMDENLSEQEPNSTVSASSINETADTAEDTMEETGPATGFISIGTLTDRVNYDVSSIK